MRTDNERSRLIAAHPLRGVGGGAIKENMNILIIDTETTSTAEDAQVCEVGAVLFSVEHMTILQSFSTLVPVKKMPDEALAVHGISAELTQLLYSHELARHSVIQMAKQSEYTFAHFAEFDRKFFNYFSIPTWICTATELTFPKQQRPGQSLVALCVAHGVPVVYAHRALDDCLLLARLLQSAFTTETLKDAIEEALVPHFEYQALVSFEEKQKAKDAGFRWDGDRKMWVAKLKKTEIAGLKFDVKELYTEL